MKAMYSVILEDHETYYRHQQILQSISSSEVFLGFMTYRILNGNLWEIKTILFMPHVLGF
jgi:hypothetical protein